jgi:putative ABC transport system ATP-binding protein
MIEITDLYKIYRMGDVEVRALDGVTLTIEKGEFIGISGASGSGKTTFLHMLGLLDTPTSGRIVIDGLDISTLTDYQKTMFRLYKLGFVFQDYALVPDLTVMENVSIPAMLRKDRTEEQSRKESFLILQKIGLCDRRDHLPRELSGGQQQRVSIARAMVNRPDILFADEPCANLDSENSRMVLDLFREINEELHQTVVMVSHEDWHKEYFHRIVNLRDGKVVSDSRKEVEPVTAAESLRGSASR